MNNNSFSVVFPTTGSPGIPATSGVNSSFSTSAIGIFYQRGYSYQAVYNGNVVGTASILSSNDGVNFSTITGSSQVLSGAGNFVWNADGAYYKYARFSFATTGAGPASTGSMTVYFTAKSA